MAGFKVSSLVKDYKKAQVTGTYEINADSPSIHFLTPENSEAVVTIAQVEAGGEFSIYNLSATHSLTVKNSTGLVVLATIEPESSVSLTSTGDNYVQGPKGPKGDAGPKGETGEQGPAGTGGSDIASKSGVTTIEQNSDTVTVDFGENSFTGNESRIVVCSVSNTTDSNPNLVAAMVTAKSNSGFTVKLSATVSTSNYTLEWMAR